MSTTVSDFVLQRLVAWGIETVYGYPGDGINGLLGAFNRIAKNGNAIRFVQTRHEETAALAACGHAKLTGKLGVCVATSGPGAIHLLNGLYDAKLDHAPVLAIVGQAARSAIGSDYQQEVDLPTLFKDVAHEYVHVAMTASQVRHLVDRAIRTALAERTVTCVILPKDVQELAYESPPREHDTAHTGPGYSPPVIVPAVDDLDHAAAILNAGERVAMLIGAGARGAEAEVLAVADMLGAGIAKALLARDILADDLPFVTGPIGLLGTKPSSDMMRQCDTLLMVGSSFPYAEFLPKEGHARGVQIDIDAKHLGLRYPMEVNLVGDAKATLAALLPRLERKHDTSFRAEIAGWIGQWWKLLEARAKVEATPLNPERVFWELSSRLPDRCIVVADSGTATTYWARDLKLRPGMRATVSGGLATMGCAIPYALAAKLAYPDLPVIACVGDGAMQMNGMAELLTVSRYVREWGDPRFIVLVLDNSELALVTWEMRAMEGNPKYPASQDLPRFNYAQFAGLAGFAGLRVEHPSQIGPAWDAALTSRCPVVIDAVTDPNVPPLPPHIDLDQAKAFALSVLKSKGEERGAVLKKALKNLVPTR